MPHPRPARTKGDGLVPAALLALSLVPVLAGVSRIVRLTSEAPAVPDDARFLASPTPVVIHILVVSLYCILGAFQFSQGIRRKPWHRIAGRILVPCGLLAALTGLWMTLFYSPISTDSQLLYGLRLVVGTAMLGAILRAVHAISQRNFQAHGAWMIRGYALGQGAGTQVFTHLPWLLFIGTPGPTSRALLMGAGWLINILVAEWVIRKWLSEPRAGL